MSNMQTAVRWLNTKRQLLQQTVRLMVGVGDYQAYVAHMKQQHPRQTPMSEPEYFRYCQDVRYGAAKGSVRRCPC